MRVSAHVEVKNVDDVFKVVVHTRREGNHCGSQVVCEMAAGANAAQRALWLQNLFAEIEMSAREDAIEVALKIARTPFT